MTSVFGTDTGFYDISNDHLYLNLNDSDKVFNSDLSYCTLKQNGLTDTNMILNRESENPLLNQQYLRDIAKYEDNCKSSLIRNKSAIPISSKKVTIYSLISEMPYLSENKKIIDGSMYYDVLNNTDTPITYFAFDNDATEVAHEWLQQYNTVYHTREFLRANTLPFGLNPSTLVGKKIELTTKSQNNKIYMDGTGKELFVIMRNDILRNYEYYNNEIRIKVKGWIETNDKCWLYVLEAPIIPTILL
jgi:hypothetical protein